MNDSDSAHDRVRVALPELDALVKKALLALGLTTAESHIIAEVLSYAELRGKQQGYIKILEKTVVPDSNRTAIGIEQRAASVHHLEANGNPGMVVLREAADIAINACERHGVAISATSGTATSTGSIGYYAERIAQHGFIGIIMAGSPKVVALHGGTSRAVGTNPLAVAIPSNDQPLVIDLATSAITWFEVIHAERERAELPREVALDSEGNPTVDPAAALQGLLKTFGGVKGSALALVIEMLTGPITGASILGDQVDRRGNLVLAFNPALLNPDHRNQVSELLERIRRESPGIKLPGDTSRALAEEQLSSGFVSVSRRVHNGLQTLAVPYTDQD